MPRKFHDNELVGVHFSTRRIYSHFFGRVEEYANGKYHVRCLAGDKPFAHDMVFVCVTRELYQPNNSLIDDMRETVLQIYHRLVEAQANGNSYQGRLSSMLWASFSLKRLENRAWDRQYPITHKFERSDYVY
tara:strand:- start:1453 stop:1848 length:396 start_codon:yes stop_codon:yes gene_type:complete